MARQTVPAIQLGRVGVEIESGGRLDVLASATPRLAVQTLDHARVVVRALSVARLSVFVDVTWPTAARFAIKRQGGGYIIRQGGGKLLIQGS